MTEVDGLRQHVETKPIGWQKIAEIAFWGAVIWGFARMIASYFSFTPYGVRAFSRALIGREGENSLTGILIGFIVLLVFSVIATLLYSAVLTRVHMWWGGILYGIVWFILFGFFFHIAHWTVNTLSTELTWFLSLGMFIGMSVSAEKMDVE